MTRKTKAKLELASLIAISGVDLNRFIPNKRNPKDQTKLEDMAKIKIAELRRELKKQKRVPKKFRDDGLIKRLILKIEDLKVWLTVYLDGTIHDGQLEEFRSYLGARNY